MARRPVRHTPADEHADFATQGHGIRAAEEGGRLIRDFHARLSRYKLQEPRLARRTLADDPAITAAVQAHMAEHGLPEPAVRRQVRKYLDEIIPPFTVLILPDLPPHRRLRQAMLGHVRLNGGGDRGIVGER